MSKSFSAKVLSEILELFSVYLEKNSEKLLENARKKGESPSPQPKEPKTRFEDTPNGRVFYANEDGKAGVTVFYLHGGAYFMDFTRSHWKLMNTMVEKADATVIAPAYRLLPFATWKDAFDLVIPLYKEYCEAHPDQKIVLMGDSAGGGLSAALAEEFIAQGIRMPDELVLLSPWVDISMENEQIKEYEDLDPFLSVSPLTLCGDNWRGNLDPHDRRVSPIYGSLEGIRHVTVFLGTAEIFYPDVTKFFGMLEDDPSNELIIGEEMCHVYPLFPISEAKPAVEKIIEVLKRR